MSKALKTVVLTSAIALSSAFATVAYADGYRNEGGNSQSQYQGQDQAQQQNQGQNQGQNQTANGGQGGQGGQGGTGTGVGIGTAISGSTSVSGATSTSGANAQTGAIDIQNNSAGGAANASTGAISNTVAPHQSTVNSFRSFVGTNAPNLSGSVDNCLAVLGWSAAVNVFGSTGVGIGGGNQRAEYIEQCAAVKSAFEIWNRASGDIAKETFAIEMLIKALPTYGQPAMDKAVERINTYIENNGDAEPDSVMNVFGARAFRKSATAPANDAPAINPNGLTINVNPVVHTVEKHTKEVRTVVPAAAPKKKPAAPAPAPKPKAPCDCAK